MLKIGDFSKLSQVSIQTLRHYDDLGLLKPVEVDQFTGYRYYAFQQLHRLNRILALKDMGLSLEQIGHLLENDLPANQLRGMLRLKQAEIEQQVTQDRERLARVEARLRQIEMEDTMPNYDILIKKVEPQLVASIRDIIPRYNAIGPLFIELATYLAQQNGGQTAVWQGQGGGFLPVAVWQDDSYKETDVDAEAAAYLKSPLPASERVKVYKWPGGQMASTVHNGAYNSLPQAHSAVHAWIEANGYRISGPARELYMYTTNPIRQDDESYVTEIQVPVEKA